MDKCRLCQADIIWGRARTSRRWLPLDGVCITQGVRFIVDAHGTAHTTTVGPGHKLHVDGCPAKNQPPDEQGELDV
jgi:hypothetical protein